MLKKLSLFTVLMTAGMGLLSADFNESDNRWRVTGEYLYYMPSVDDTYYVIDADPVANFIDGKRHNNDFDFHSGYRVGVGYSFCDCNRELFANYTNLTFNQSDRVSGDSLWATVGNADFVNLFEDYAGTAYSKLDFQYQRLDVLYSQQIYNCCKLNVAVQFGLEAVELRLKERNRYVEPGTSLPNVGIVKQYSKAEAIGPQIGFAFDYELYRHCGCLPGTLSFNVLSSVSLLAADNKTHLNSTINDGEVFNVKNKKSWRVIPALHASVGFSYDMTIACRDASIGVGYDFSSYIRGVSRIAFPDEEADALSYNNYYNFDVQGLYVSASVRF